MSEGAKIFSLKNTILLVAGVDIGSIGGFAESDFLEIDPASDRFTVTEGCDGTAAFADTQSNVYNVKIKLLQTSKANLALSGIYETQASTKLVFPIVYKDLAGVDLFIAAGCVITKPPKITRGNKITMQEWSLVCADGKPFYGGN